MSLCWLLGHNYTRPAIGTELVRGTNPFCYRCGKAPENITDIQEHIISILRDIYERVEKMEKDLETK